MRQRLRLHYPLCSPSKRYLSRKKYFRTAGRLHPLEDVDKSGSHSLFKPILVPSAPDINFVSAVYNGPAEFLIQTTFVVSWAIAKAWLADRELGMIHDQL